MEVSGEVSMEVSGEDSDPYPTRLLNTGLRYGRLGRAAGDSALSRRDDGNLGGVAV